MSQEIATVREFIGHLRRGPYTSIGSYPLFFWTHDGEVISFKAAKENVWEQARKIRDRDRERIEGIEVNYESRDLYCVISNERIESAYAEDKEDEDE